MKDKMYWMISVLIYLGLMIQVQAKDQTQIPEGVSAEEYEAIMMDRLVTIELRFAGGNWYVMASDGLKQS